MKNAWWGDLITVWEVSCNKAYLFPCSVRISSPCVSFQSVNVSNLCYLLAHVPWNVGFFCTHIDWMITLRFQHVSLLPSHPYFYTHDATDSQISLLTKDFWPFFKNSSILSKVHISLGDCLAQNVRKATEFSSLSFYWCVQEWHFLGSSSLIYSVPLYWLTSKSQNRSEGYQRDYSGCDLGKLLLMVRLFQWE